MAGCEDPGGVRHARFVSMNLMWCDLQSVTLHEGVVYAHWKKFCQVILQPGGCGRLVEYVGGHAPNPAGLDDELGHLVLETSNAFNL